MNDLCAWHVPCSGERVSGSTYCEDHLLQTQVKATRPAATGTLASLIRKARTQGLLKPVSAYAGN